MIPDSRDGIRGENGKVVLLIEPLLALDAKRLLNLVVHDLLVGRVIVLDRNPVIEDFRMDFMEGSDGKVCRVVVWILAATERGLALFHHTDHAKHVAANFNFLTQRIFAAE